MAPTVSFSCSAEPKINGNGYKRLKNILKLFRRLNLEAQNSIAQPVIIIHVLWDINS